MKRSASRRTWVHVYCLLVLGVAGCTTVHPPDPLAISRTNAVRVYILHSTAHAALAIPEKGTYVAWGFGDRAYMTSSGPFNSWVRGPMLVCIGPFGCLRSSVLERVPLNSQDPEGISAEMGMSARLLIADQQCVDRLSAELNARFNEGARRGHDDSMHDATHWHRYSTVWYACGNAVADWCRKLNAEVPWKLVRWGPWSVKRGGKAPPKPAAPPNR